MRAFVNYDISVDSGLAAQAAIVGKTSTLPKMRFCFTRVGQVRCLRHDAVFRHLAFCNLDLATAAQGASATNRVDIHPETTGCLQDRCAHGKSTPLSRRGKDDKRIAFSGHVLLA